MREKYKLEREGEIKGGGRERVRGGGGRNTKEREREIERGREIQTRERGGREMQRREGMN